jgi:uncharacterized protein involved in outer membrane biogenesis
VKRRGGEPRLARAYERLARAAAGACTIECAARRPSRPADLSRRKLLVAVLAVCVFALAAAAAVGIPVDAERWREPVAAALSRALGREVRIDGPAQLVLSLRPAVAVGGIRIANPPGFDAPDFARIGELRLGVELLPLLGGEARVRDLAARHVAVRLARASDGSGNWVFEGRAADAAEREPAGRPRLAVHRFTLEQVLVEYPAGDAVRRVELAALAGEARPGEPVRLAVRGMVDGTLPLTGEATAGPLAALGGPVPWPFDAQLFLPGAALNASGTLTGPIDRPAVRVAIGAGTADAGPLERLLGVALPGTGGAAVAMVLDAVPGRVRLDAINGVAGATPFAGELVLDGRAARPKLGGRLAIPALDLRARPSGAVAAEPGETETLAAAFGRLETADLGLARLARFDADLEVAVGHWAGVPGDARDLSARIRVDGGRLAAPLALTVAGARLEGELAADGAAVPPRLRVQLAAREAPLGGLAELVFDARYVAGDVRAFEVTLEAAGATAADLARDLEARVRIDGARLTYGNYPGGRPVAMRLDAAELGQPRGGTIAGKLRGALRGKPFAGTFRAGTVERILRDRRTPFGFDGASGGVRARLSGTLAEPDAAAGPVIAFDVAAPRARELAPWLGFSSESDARVALKGAVEVRRRYAALTGASLLVGRTAVAGDLVWQTTSAKPLVKANLVAELLAPAEIRELAPPRKAERATVLEIPILPESLDFADSDVELRVKRFDGLPLAVTDAVFEGRMRDGVMSPSPVSLRVESSALAGALALDARTDSPVASLWLAGRDFDAGALLRRLRVARDVDARFGLLRLYAEVRERRLGDALERSSLVASVESGALEFRDANTRAALRVAIDAGELRADPGAPVTASLSGTTGTLPVALKVQTGSLRELVEPGARLPFSLAAETPAAKLAISGTAVPGRQPDAALSFSLTGTRLSDLDGFAEASLPPWGPYAFTGRVRLSQRGYEADGVRLALGASALEGRGALDTSTAPPRFDLALAAERIQLDDFPVGDWSPFESSGAPAGPLTVEGARAAVAAGARQAHAIFGRELLRRADGDFALAVKRVASGADELGRGRLVLRIANGRATIGPAELDARAGSARGTLVYEPRERDVLVDAVLTIDRLDYGVLARRFRPGADVDGALSLDLRVAGTPPRLAAAFATGSGRFDFALWPDRVRIRTIDLWSANLLFRLLPIIDVTASEVNCIVGHFDLERGRLESRRLIIDTVNTRTVGGGFVDLGTDEVRLRFVPRAKVPQFFSLATPIEVRGTTADYRFGVRPADMFGTAARWVASPVVVPIQRLAGERIPPDGADACANPGR